MADFVNQPEKRVVEETVDLATPSQPASLSDYSPESTPWDPVRHRALSARWVAGIIVGTFAATIGLVLLSLVVLVAIIRNPDDAKLFAETLVSVLDSLGKFLTSVFAPLLAFVLGYYFSEKQREG